MAAARSRSRLREGTHRMGGETERDLVPADVYVRMMARSFGQGGDGVDIHERFGEVPPRPGLDKLVALTTPAEAVLDGGVDGRQVQCLHWRQTSLA